jgi:hypothetical protein
MHDLIVTGEFVSCAMEDDIIFLNMFDPEGDKCDDINNSF